MTVIYDDPTAPSIRREPRGLDDKCQAAMQNNPTTKLITVGELLQLKPQGGVAAVDAALQKAPRAALERGLAKAVRQRSRTAAWLINREFTRRGVPPAFRSSLIVNYDEPEYLLDCLAVDLAWIAYSYPDHRTFFERWRKSIDHRYLHSQSLYIFNYSGRGKRPIHILIKGLALTIDQQRECHYAKLTRFDNQHMELRRLLPEVRSRIEGRHVTRLRRSRGDVIKLLPEDDAIIKRRADVWFCANLGDWKPTRTATLYNALTGAGDATDPAARSPMTRQQAANVMADLERDIPKNVARPL